MRSTFRNLIGVCIAAIGLCFSGFGFADVLPDRISALRFAVSDIGSYGAESAKLKAELAHMQAIDSDRTGSFGALTSESNGFRLTSMVTASSSGVAKGKMGGSGAGLHV